MLINLICLSSCTTINSDYCPIYPIAGRMVAEEINNIEGKHFWEWIGRIDKLRRQLELCKKKEP